MLAAEGGWIEEAGGWRAVIAILAVLFAVTFAAALKWTWPLMLYGLIVLMAVIIPYTLMAA